MPSGMFSSSKTCCGNLTTPGLAIDFDLYVNYSDVKTTEDQLRIEDAMNYVLPTESRILHVGIGNSQLAKKMCSMGHFVEGLTVSKSELIYAKSLNLKNYKASIINKYHRDFTNNIEPDSFDVVVDNNLASFACCQYHFYTMIDNYLSCLKFGGAILTDQRGMDWALLDPGFIISFEQLKNILCSHSVDVQMVTEMVYSIVKIKPYDDKNNTSFRVHTKRNVNGKIIVKSFTPST